MKKRKKQASKKVDRRFKQRTTHQNTCRLVSCLVLSCGHETVQVISPTKTLFLVLCSQSNKWTGKHREYVHKLQVSMRKSKRSRVCWLPCFGATRRLSFTFGLPLSLCCVLASNYRPLDNSERCMAHRERSHLNLLADSSIPAVNRHHVSSGAVDQQDQTRPSQTVRFFLPTISRKSPLSFVWFTLLSPPTLSTMFARTLLSASKRSVSSSCRSRLITRCFR